MTAWERKIKITTAQGAQYNTATTAVGYNSSSDKRVHFGLGPAVILDAIELILAERHQAGS